MSTGDREYTHPDDRGQLERQDVQVSQFGGLHTTQRVVEAYLQGQYSPTDLRETVAQIDGSDLSGASVTGSASQISPSGLLEIDSGTVAGESVKVESNRALDYAPGNIAEFSGLIFRDSGPTGDQVLRFGAFTDEDGVFFEETADELRAVIRDGSGGSVTDRVLGASDTAVMDGILSLQKPLLAHTRIWVIRFSHYGAGKVIFGTRESHRINPRDPGRTRQTFLTYDATKDELDRMYMRTANLPMRIEIDNDPADTTSPSSSLTAYAGDRQLALYGDQPKQARQLVQQYSGLTANADSPTEVCAIRPQSRHAGVPNGVNVTLESIEITVDGGTSPVRFWTEVGPDIATGTFDDSGYSGQQSAAEIGLGAPQTNGDIDATVGTGIDIQPAGTVAVGTQGSSPSASGESSSDTPLGAEQPAVLWAEGQGGSSSFDLTLKWRESQ